MLSASTTLASTLLRTVHDYQYKSPGGAYMREAEQVFIVSLTRCRLSKVYLPHFVEAAATRLGTNEQFVTKLLELCKVEDHAGVKGELIICLFYYSDRYNIYEYTISIIGKNSTVYPAYLWHISHFCLLV